MDKVNNDTPQSRIYYKGIDDITVTVLEEQIVRSSVSLGVPRKCACITTYTCSRCLARKEHEAAQKIPVIWRKSF